MTCIEITDEDFDDVHHALGRPKLDVLKAGENYRNYYVVEVGSPWAARAETLGMWDRITRVGSTSTMVTYRVNADGKAMLIDRMTLQQEQPK